MKIRKVVSTIAVVALALGLIAWNLVTSLNAYNGGVCRECGGHYHIVVSPNHTVKSYTYECDGCANTITSLIGIH